MQRIGLSYCHTIFSCRIENSLGGNIGKKNVFLAAASRQCVTNEIATPIRNLKSLNPKLQRLTQLQLFLTPTQQRNQKSSLKLLILLSITQAMGALSLSNGKVWSNSNPMALVYVFRLFLLLFSSDVNSPGAIIESLGHVLEWAENYKCT